MGFERAHYNLYKRLSFSSRTKSLKYRSSREKDDILERGRTLCLSMARQRPVFLANILLNVIHYEQGEWYFQQFVVSGRRKPNMLTPFVNPHNSQLWLVCDLYISIFCHPWKIRIHFSNNNFRGL